MQTAKEIVEPMVSKTSAIRETADSLSGLFIRLNVERGIDGVFNNPPEGFNQHVPETFKKDVKYFSSLIQDKDPQIPLWDYWLTLSHINYMVGQYFDYETSGKSSERDVIERDLSDVANLLKNKKLRTEMVDLLRKGYGSNRDYVTKVFYIVESRIKK
jgi:hypothetical protein